MRAIPFFIGMFIYIQGITQSNVDTLKVAQDLVQQKELKKAEKLLDAYHQTHQNSYSFQLHAQLLIWTEQPRQALALYKRGITLFPSANFLQLDYGRALFQLGKLKESKVQLERYIQSDSLHAEAHIMLAYIEAWQGNAKAAKQRVGLLKKYYPANSSVKELAQYIDRFYASNINAGYSFLSDDQPLRSNQFRAGYTAYRSALFSPFVSGSFAQFNEVGGGSNTSWMQAGNLWQFGYGGTKIRTAAGVFSNTQTGSLLTIELSLRQKLSTALSLELAAMRQPYQNTRSSIEFPFLYNLLNGSLQFDRKHVAGSVGVDVKSFDDGNKVAKLFAWTLLPILKTDWITLKAGYSYSYSNANKSSFTPAKSVTEVAQSQNVYTLVPGYYVPYFTPAKQQIHAFLANVTVGIHSNIRMQGTASYGFSANADNPVLQLDKNGNNFFISRSFYRQAYTPVEIETGLETEISAPLSLQLKYKYSRLVFYTLNEANLQLNYRFIK